MSEPKNYLSTLCAVLFIFLLPIGFVFLLITLLLNGGRNSTILNYLGLIGAVMIFFGFVFFIMHYVMKFIERIFNPTIKEMESDILDDEMIEP